MKKRNCMVFQIVLLVWFFLDMIGVYFDGKCLVTRSYTDDGIFFCNLFNIIGIVYF